MSCGLQIAFYNEESLALDKVKPAVFDFWIISWAQLPEVIFFRWSLELKPGLNSFGSLHSSIWSAVES